MSVFEQHLRVAEFIHRWENRGHEKQETQRFWIDLLQNVLDIRNATESTLFEYPTVGGGYIDVLFPDARLLVEQKSSGIDLDKPEIRQDIRVTPVQQALRYADALPYSMKPEKYVPATLAFSASMIWKKILEVWIDRQMNSLLTNWENI